MSRVRFRAFAKVNYALEVRGLRGDGYHEISTVLQSISLADEVEIEHVREGFSLSVEPEEMEIGAPEENTAYKAWTLLCERVGEELPVEVRLRKEIPAGAGLGGASADAAAVLVGLNELFGLGLSREDLHEMGGWIGADVPFCLSGGTMLGEGIGEILTPLPAPPAHRLLLAKPASGAETGKIYRTYDELPDGGTSSVGPVVAALRAGELRALAAALANDLAPVTRGLVPEVGSYEQRLLEAGALGAAMSGSGTAVYGVFGSEGKALMAGEDLRAPFVGVYEPVSCGVEVLADEH